MVVVRLKATAHYKIIKKKLKRKKRKGKKKKRNERAPSKCPLAKHRDFQVFRNTNGLFGIESPTSIYQSIIK